MAKIKPPMFKQQYSLSGRVAWTDVKEAGLLSLLELPRDEQVMIVQYKHSWFKPTGWVKPKGTSHTKKWWDTLTGDQQTVRWVLAFSVRCRKGYEADVPMVLPTVGFYDPVSEQNATAWYASIPPHLAKSVEAEIAKLPGALEAKKSDELYQQTSKVWGERPELPEDHPDGEGLRGDEDFRIEVWREWAYLYTNLLTVQVIVKEAPRIQAERKMLSQALGLTDAGTGFPPQSDGLEDTQAATVRWIQQTGATPLEFLAETYRDDTLKAGDRISAARAMLDFVHRKVPVKTEIETKDTTETKLDPKVLKGLNDKELATLESLLKKMKVD